MLLKLLEIYSALKEGKFLIDLKNLFSREKGIAVAFIMLFVCVYVSFTLVSNDDSEYNRTVKDSKLDSYIVKSLKECGNGVAISVSRISQKLIQSPYEESEYYSGVFKEVMVCDSQFVKSQCVLSLKEIKEFYDKEFEIDGNSYELFIRSAYNTEIFYLINEGKQDISKTRKYEIVSEIIQNTDWFNLGILKELRIASVLKKELININGDPRVIYVITFLTNINNNNFNCDANEIIRQIKLRVSNYD